MAKVISLFNHKGGVSKTTSTYHIGWKMASLGKKVLIIDADPQCNLTGLTLGLEDYDSLFAFYDSKRNTDIFNSLAPIFALDGNSPPIQKTDVTATKNPNLFILAGHIRFAEIDTQIATAITSSGTIPILKRFIGAINALIRKLIQVHEFDIVLIDMSPSVSATNNCILMSSDYFIIPTSPDFYCYQAIDSLSNVLPKWSDNIASFRLGNDDYSLPKAAPKMLGFISQNYRVYTTDSKLDENDPKSMSRAYSAWLDKIKDITNTKLVPSLQQKQMVVEKELFMKAVNYDAPYHLAGIQNFNTLIPTSQKLSKPIYELTQEDGRNAGTAWAGATWEREEKGKKYGVKYNIEQANTVYTALCKSLLEMVA